MLETKIKVCLATYEALTTSNAFESVAKMLSTEGWELDERFGRGTGVTNLENSVIYYLIKFASPEERKQHLENLAKKKEEKALVEAEFQFSIKQQIAKKIIGYRSIELVPTSNPKQPSVVDLMLEAGWVLDEGEHYASKSTKFVNVILYKKDEEKGNVTSC